MRLLFERLAFTGLVVGILLIGYAAYQVFTINHKLDNNIAEQIKRNGEQIDPKSNEEVQGLVSADMERRQLHQDRSRAYEFGGAGLALIGLGWLGYDLLSNRKRRADKEIQATTPSEVTET